MGLVTLLFALSEDSLHRDNSFIRRFPQHPAMKTHQLDLKYNSYYIAGVERGNIYLGNPTAPMLVTILDTALLEKKEVQIGIGRDSLPFRHIQLRVLPPYFFFMDGTVPFILRGNISDWESRSIMMNEPIYFSKVQAIDSVTLAVRTSSSRTNEHVLGTISLLDTARIDLSHELLQTQAHGLFDTDGTLQYNSQLNRLVYSYLYRNQYIVADDDLQLDHFGKTIDTVSQAQVQVARIASKNRRELAAPPLMVNKYSATYGNYLFVNANLIGRHEPTEMWEIASIIDVYNIVENTYQFSFYIQDIGNEKLKNFQVHNDKLIGLIGNHIVIYQLDENRFKDLWPTTKEFIDQKITAISESP